jgi:cytochrome P450
MATDTLPGADLQPLLQPVNNMHRWSPTAESPLASSAQPASPGLAGPEDRAHSRKIIQLLGGTHMAFGRGIHACPGAPLARTEARVTLERLFDRTTDIRIDEAQHGPAGARRYEYVPTFILRGLMELHLEFTPVDAAAR